MALGCGGMLADWLSKGKRKKEEVRRQRTELNVQY